jgi:hypothetical protein
MMIRIRPNDTRITHLQNLCHLYWTVLVKMLSELWTLKLETRANDAFLIEDVKNIFIDNVFQNISSQRIYHDFPCIII